MTNNNTPKVTPADVAKVAAEEKLVTTVPAQGEKVSEDTKVTVTLSDEKSEQPKLTVVEGGKKSFKDRLESLTAKLKDNQKTVVAVGLAVAAATVVIVKFAQKQVEMVLVENVDGLTDEQKLDIIHEMEAAEIGG